MLDFVQQLVSGIALGCVYGLIALGFVLVYKATEVVNFAQGDLMMLGGFFAFTFIALLELSRDVPVAAADLVRADGSCDDMLAVARVVIAAYQVGGMAEMLDMSIHHSNTREQFGTPVGRFQRVQEEAAIDLGLFTAIGDTPSSAAEIAARFDAFTDALRMGAIAVSLGDLKTLVYPMPKRDNLIRLSVGIEDVEDLYLYRRLGGLEAVAAAQAPEGRLKKIKDSKSITIAALSELTASSSAF